jgi:hypothetical protein
MKQRADYHKKMNMISIRQSDVALNTLPTISNPRKYRDRGSPAFRFTSHSESHRDEQGMPSPVSRARTVASLLTKWSVRGNRRKARHAHVLLELRKQVKAAESLSVSPLGKRSNVMPWPLTAESRLGKHKDFAGRVGN